MGYININNLKVDKMALVSKRYAKKKRWHSQSGQVTFFFASILILIITFVAFVINIGMFVKAKINLQNAVDAAAWSGAAVQSRQLTDVSYLNYEMRANYKEWMFKYYVLGNLSIKDVYGNSNDPVQFTMQKLSSGPIEDPYNFPSICVHYGGQGVTNICKYFAIPGVPRFHASNTVGVDTVTEDLINSIVAAKSTDCAYRSDINFLAANMWAYNVTTDSPNGNAFSQAMPIAANRMGAWPAAFNLAVRMRNLEKVVNLNPISGICREGSENEECRNDINNIINAGPAYERPVKAYYSGMRNLGGADCDSGDRQDLKCSFTLTEIPPEEYVQEAPNHLSNLLIPQANKYAKHYLDLQLHVLNLSTFFTSFAASADAGGAGNNAVTTEGSCVVTKIGLPVPGFPFGFVKNSEVLTYYAVKGSALFNGLFNPFGQKVKLTAYAAAKPFGGRVGPHLFKTQGAFVQPRSSKKRSGSYISGLDLTNALDKNGNQIPSGSYAQGMPLPFNTGDSTFWISGAADAIGGWTDSNNLRFGIPNLVYEYESGAPYYSTDLIDQISVGASAVPTAGLYNKSQFDQFKANLGDTSAVNAAQINEAIYKVRAPTSYDTANYLIPSTQKQNNDIQSMTYAPMAASGNSNGSAKLKIFAPLYFPGGVFQSAQDVIGELNGFLSFQEKAVEKYRTSMNKVALSIYESFKNIASAELAVSASKTFSDIDVEDDTLTAEDAKPTCASTAGKFIYFFTGKEDLINGNTGCSVSFPAQMETFLNSTQNSNTGSTLFYENPSFYFKPNTENKIFSAFGLGPYQGAGGNFTWTNDVFSGNGPQSTRRNFYSTKFVSLKSVSKTQKKMSYNNSNFPIVSEGQSSTNQQQEDYTQIGIKNTLNLLDAGIDESTLDRFEH